MEGCLLHIGKVLFPRSFSLSAFLLICCALTVHAKTVVIGSGLGFISVPDMNGLNPGDVLAITPGQYSGGAFNNLKGITITNNGGTVVFSGQVTLNTLIECVFSGFQFKNVTGISIRWDGNSRRCIEKNIYFQDCTGNTNDASDHNPYTGDTSSLKLYMCTFDSLTLFRSGMVMMGSWGDAAAQICYIDSVVFSRIRVDSTLTNGVEVRGVIFRLDAHDWKVTYKGINTVSGDVGIFYIVGNGAIHDIYRTGGRGYILRIWNTGLKSVGNTYFYNNIDLNSMLYGSLDTRMDPAQFTQYVTGGNCYIFNNTSGNKGDNIGYWAALAVVGIYAQPYICQTRNNLGFNLTTRGKPPITMNQSNGTWVSDSSNNMYFDKPDGVVDPVTGIPVSNSPVLGKGLILPLVQDDYYHNPRTGAYDIGAVQHSGAIIPPPPNQPPVAVAGAAQTITAPTGTVTLNGSASYDPDGTISAFSWVLISGPAAVTISNANTAGPVVTGFIPGVYTFQLSVTDNSGASGTDQVLITVNPAVNKENQLPVALAGPDTTIYLPAGPYLLNASRSYDPDGMITSYQWQQISGPNTAIASSMNSSEVDITHLEPGLYEFRLTVTDNLGATSSALVKIAVDQPSGPGDQLTVFPNPAHDLIQSRITSPVNGKLRMNIYDMNGRVVLTNQSGKSTEIFEESLNINSLAAGMYTIQVNITNRKTLAAKFIKQ